MTSAGKRLFCTNSWKLKYPIRSLQILLAELSTVIARETRNDFNFMEPISHAHSMQQQKLAFSSGQPADQGQHVISTAAQQLQQKKLFLFIIFIIMLFQMPDSGWDLLPTG